MDTCDLCHDWFSIWQLVFTGRQFLCKQCNQTTTTNMNINLEAAIKRIKVHGPDRMMINAVEASRPVGQIRPDIVFIREDGWSLGARSPHESHAFALWKDQWIAFMRKGDDKPIAIEHYCPSPEHPCPRCGSACEYRAPGKHDEQARWVCTHCTYDQLLG